MKEEFLPEATGFKEYVFLYDSKDIVIGAVLVTSLLAFLYFKRKKKK